MTEREEFEKWFDENNLNTTNHTKELMQKAWQARGELDDVRIKELEADQEGLLDDTQKLANALLAQEKQVAELTAKLDKAKEALKWIDEVNAIDYEYVKVARQALEELNK